MSVTGPFKDVAPISRNPRVRVVYGKDRTADSKLAFASPGTDSANIRIVPEWIGDNMASEVFHWPLNIPSNDLSWDTPSYWRLSKKATNNTTYLYEPQEIYTYQDDDGLRILDLRNFVIVAGSAPPTIVKTPATAAEAARNAAAHRAARNEVVQKQSPADGTKTRR